MNTKRRLKKSSLSTSATKRKTNVPIKQKVDFLKILDEGTSSPELCNSQFIEVSSE